MRPQFDISHSKMKMNQQVSLSAFVYISVHTEAGLHGRSGGEAPPPPKEKTMNHSTTAIYWLPI